MAKIINAVRFFNKLKETEKLIEIEVAKIRNILSEIECSDATKEKIKSALLEEKAKDLIALAELLNSFVDEQEEVIEEIEEIEE